MAPQFAVESLDLEKVVEDVGADLGNVRQKVGHAHVVDIHSGAQAGAFFVGAVRVFAAEPEAERAAVVALPEKSFEVGEEVPGGIARASAGVVDAGAPSLFA